ncbi:MAG: methionyl-tRNA formyltransferase [Candidatus Moraniibacteriota bacterium]
MSEASSTRVVFMGTPHFAETMLQSIVGAGYNVVAAYTQPDRPSGRNQEVVQSPVKIFADTHSIPVKQPVRFDSEAKEMLRALKPDIIIVAAYGKILPQEVLDIPPFGCINIHASLLPRWRGASPVQNALLAGDTETGVTIMKMDAGMDTGAIFKQKTVPIDPLDTTATLLPKLAKASTALLIPTLEKWLDKEIEPTPQETSGITLCQLIEREDGKVFWSDEAESIYNRYRALSPWPGIFSFWRKDGSLLRIKFHSISLQKQSPEIHHDLGQVFEIGETLGVATTRGTILLDEIQLEGKSCVSAKDFIRGYPDFVGSILE